MQSITLQCVKYAALLLIEQNESTSTLDVKRLLRHIGFHATQMEVSELMLQASDELPLTRTPNGQFIDYTLPEPSQVINQPATSSNVTVSSAHPGSPYVYARRDGVLMNGHDIDDGYSTNDWEVTSVVDDSTLWFDKNYSRDQVRQAYASLHHVSFYNTRASRL